MRSLVRFATRCGALAIALMAGSAQAQFLGGDCGCSAPIHSVSVSTAATACQTIVHPVAQSCYQPVAVTEYHPVTQTVRRPKVEARVVNQDVIEYVPVTEQRTADVPHTTYQDVTECQQITRNVGYWHTHVQQNYKPSPCEIDNRRTFGGWMNRSAYEFKAMFTPTHTVHRQFVPQTMVQTVPVTRRVAIPGTRQVTYNVTRMVANRTTRQVAVNHMTYEDVQTTVHVPRTVVRHVPIGTQTSYAPLSPGSSSISLQPTPDSSMSARRPAASQSATNRPKDQFDPTADPSLYNKSNDVPIKPKGASYRPAPQPGLQDGPVTQSPAEDPAVVRRSSPPSMVRLNQWVARTPKLPEGPTSDMSLADVHR